MTEGFSGNIALKAAEGTARQFARALRGALSSSWRARIGYLFARTALGVLRDTMDPGKSNGSVLLGLNGIVVKSHGGTDAEGFANAIDVGSAHVYGMAVTGHGGTVSVAGGSVGDLNYSSGIEKGWTGDEP